MTKRLESQLVIVDLTKPDAERSESLPSSPAVGIWWASERRIAALIHSPQDAERSGHLLDSPLEHWRQWRHVAAQFNYTAKDDYFLVPRGRVLVNTKTGKGLIYHGNATTSETLAALASVFGLGAWDAKTDEHYLVGAEADELLSEWEDEDDII